MAALPNRAGRETRETGCIEALWAKRVIAHEASPNPSSGSFSRMRRRRICRSPGLDRKSTRLNSSHSQISYAVFCLKKKKKTIHDDLVVLCCTISDVCDQA